MKLAVGEVLVAVAGITGNSMSLTDGDSAVMLTRYDGGEEKINELRKEVENNCDVLEPAPIYPNEEESFWEEESCAKCNLTGKDFDEHPASVITPYDSHVADVWSAAYLVISNANMVINALKPLTAPMSVPLTSTRRKP